MSLQSHIFKKENVQVAFVPEEKDGKGVLRELIETKCERTSTFQVMLLRNDASKDVEVHEEREVDFSRIHDHLQQGGSVFITSKPSQKIVLPSREGRTQRRRSPRTVTAFYFDHL